MASGDYLIELKPRAAMPTGTLFATPDTVADTSTPATLIPVLDFSGASNEHADWIFKIPKQYAGTTGFTFSYEYAMDGADVDLVDMEFRVITLTDNLILTGDLGIDTQTAVSIQDTPIVTVTANKFAYSPTGALAKANFGSPAAGQLVLVRATRDTTAAANADDLQLASILIRET